MQYNDGYNETIYSYANNINTEEGGSHLDGFKNSLTKIINDYAKEHNILKDEERVSGDDVREGLTAIISVKLTDPQFEGQTKTKLGNSEMRTSVAKVLTEGLGTYLEENPAVAKTIIEKAVSASRCARGRSQSARVGEKKDGARVGTDARKAAGLQRTRRGAVRTVRRGRRFGGRFGNTGKRFALSGHSLHVGKDAQRRKGACRQNIRATTSFIRLSWRWEPA